MQSSAFDSETAFRLEHGRAQRTRAGSQWNVLKAGGKRAPFALHQFARVELGERIAREAPKGVTVHIVEGDADDATLGNEPGTGEVKQTG